MEIFSWTPGELSRNQKKKKKNKCQIKKTLTKYLVGKEKKVTREL